jgi:hypothetical protein
VLVTAHVFVDFNVAWPLMFAPADEPRAVG